jgi:hypothetical protein
MSFLNKHNKEGHGDSSYLYSIKIGNFVYAIGSSARYGLITKYNLSGIVIWEKIYGSGVHESLRSYEWIKFKSAVKCENGDFLISVKSTSTGSGVPSSFFIRVNGEGQILWNKSYFPANLTSSYGGEDIRLIKLNGENYVIYTPRTLPASSDYHHYLIKIDGFGNSIITRDLTRDSSTPMYISTNGSEIILAGSTGFAIQKIPFVVLDADLNIINKFGLSPTLASQIFWLYSRGIDFKNDKIIISGGFSKLSSGLALPPTGFIAEIEYPLSQEPNTGSIAIKTFGDSALFELSSNADYTYLRFTFWGRSPIQGLKVIKLDNAFNQVWTKIIEVPDIYETQIRADSNHLLIAGKAIGALNLDLDSCKTSTSDLATSVNESLNFQTNFTTTIVNTSLIIATVPLLISEFTSVKTEICPPVLEIPTIDAVGDSIGPINGLTGAIGVLNVLMNDTLYGNPVNPSFFTVTPVVAGPLTINANGSLDVASNTPAGTYSITYTICEVANPINCDSATVTVTVVEPPVIASDDAVGPINGFTGATGVLNVLTNDTLDGNPVNPSSFTVTPVTTGPLSINSNGNLDLAPYTPAGTYSITYTICEIAKPTNCDSATVTVIVESLGGGYFLNEYNKKSAESPWYSYPYHIDSIKIGDSIYAVGQFYSAGFPYYGGNAYGLITKVDLSGAVIWEKIYGSGNDTYIDLHSILRCENDDLLVSGSNYTYNGLIEYFVIRISSEGETVWNKSYLPASVIGQNTSSGHARPELGKLDGENYIVYILNPGWIQPTNNHLIKIDGAGNIIGNRNISGISISIHGLDNGWQTTHANPLEMSTNGSEIILACVHEDKMLFLVFDSDLNLINKFGLKPSVGSGIPQLYLHALNFKNGKITVSGAFSGSYLTQVETGFIAEIDYPVSQEPNTGSIEIKTFEKPTNNTSKLYSNSNHTYLSFGWYGGPAEKVFKLDNDLNQIWAKTISIPEFGFVRISGVDTTNLLIIGPQLGSLNLNMDSCKTYANELVPFGNATLDFYSDIPATIVDAEIIAGTIPLTVSAVTSTINEICGVNAINDAIGPINGFTGSSGTLNVLYNDKSNGYQLNPSAFTVTPVTAGSITIHADGSLDVAPGTPAGTYSMTYTACEIADPTNCDSATVTVIVSAPPISANNDFIEVFDGTVGGVNVANVLSNDTLNGSPVNPSSVTITSNMSGPVTIHANGSVDVAPDTPAGTYSGNYTICEITNPTNCAFATITVTVEVLEPVIVRDSVSIQSPHLYLQAAGSRGLDSTKGNHLRWMLKGALETHLPKGGYAVPGINFNKQNDFVRIYRVPYDEQKVTLNFNQAPDLVFDANGSWVYVIESYSFTVAFKNAQKYASVRLAVDPAVNPLLFVQNYGSELIEIESKTELSFGITAHVAVANANGSVKLELLSVEENKVSSPKYVSYRKSLTPGAVNNRKIFSENIKSIRFRSSAGAIERVDFELYALQVRRSKGEREWSPFGSYALSKDSNLVFNRLEPEDGVVHGKWLRYNDDAYTNIDNYKTKWNGSSVAADEQILKTVEKYIELSNNASNPLATEIIAFNSSDEPVAGYEPDPDYNPDQDTSFELSNLNLLQIGALDYHVARMLGLGVLDLEPDSDEQKYLYMAEYVTYGDLNDGLGAREVQHVYCSLPTSIDDERLPLPVDLKEPVPGIFYGLDTEAPQLLTDEEGYSADGRTRFLTLFHQELPGEIPDAAFFYTDREFISARHTEPVYAGIEHVVYEGDSPNAWQKPEPAYDPKYFNIDDSVTADKRQETISILIPEPAHPLFVHRQKQEGKHHYGSYGINWFGRATDSPVRWSSVTAFPEVNFLLPPTNINALLIRKEAPLLLTSASEQVRLQGISDPDKTLIRLTFDYNHIQELKDYHKEINGELTAEYTELADSEEQFAETIGIFFRDEIPHTISGKIVSVENDPGNEILATVKTGIYTLTSAGTANNKIIPSFPNEHHDHFVGSVLLIDDKEFIVHEAYTGTAGYPEFKVFKRDANGTLNSFETTTPVGQLESPAAGGIFVMVENMLSVGSWGSPAPLAFEVQVDPQVAAIHREEILIVSPDALTVERHVQKFRGIYQTATISKFIETVEEYENENDTTPTTTQRHLGIYKIEFGGFSLNQHSQHSATPHAVEWMNGAVRLHTLESPDFARREFKVIRTENIGTTGNLTLYVTDPDFDENQPWWLRRNNAIVEGPQLVNYYPGYKVYLRHDESSRLTEDVILPEEGEGERYSVFGLRSQLAGSSLVSRISVPCLMFAQEINEPGQPEKPLGGSYATRPDFFGKATYSFTTRFAKKPYSVQFNRTSDIQILTALYNTAPARDAAGAIVMSSTVDFIQTELFQNGQDEYYVNRWQNLLGFNYDYPAADTVNTDGLFKKYPDNQDGVRLPLPDSPKFIASINSFIIEHNAFYKNQPAPVSTITQISSLFQPIIPAVANRNDELRVVDFVKQVIHNSFLPLTEVPVIYKYIKTEAEGYAPLPKKQVIRDRNGNLLKPEDPAFEMAPMMVIKTLDPSGNPAAGQHVIQFTDFGLDGASNARYFYAVREFDLQMKAGDYSRITGPVNLVNSNPPSAPEIVKVIPILENRVLGISPQIQFEINSYPSTQNIRKVSIYRAFSAVDALSVRTMSEARVIDLEVEGLLESDKWVFRDDFSDLAFVPYGDPLFYRIVASRIIEYSDRNGSIVIDYAPSEASKQVITNITENYSPESPVLGYASEPVLPNGELRQVVLFCNTTIYKGTYHLYKMNAQGNWVKIKATQSNSEVVYFPLEDTTLNSNVLLTKNSDGETIYHHFKVIAENTAGMFSSRENIRTVHNEAIWKDIGQLEYNKLD